MPVEAGRAPDRVGVLFCSLDVPLRAGDRVVTVEGPITGAFEIRAVPEQALNYVGAHHQEVQVVEAVQDLVAPPWSTR